MGGELSESNVNFFFFFYLNFISWLGTLRFGVHLPKYGEGLAATP